MKQHVIALLFAYYSLKRSLGTYPRRWAFGVMVPTAFVIACLVGCGAYPSRVLSVPEGCTRPTLPLSVVVDYSIAPDIESWWFEAGEDWRKAAGLNTPVFHPVTEEYGRSDVWVHWAKRGPTTGKNAIAAVFARCTDGRVWYDVQWYESTSGWESYYYVLHEVGHVLGVAHSNVSRSVMNPTLDVDFLADTDGTDDERGWYWITDYDREVVRSLWRD